MDLAKDFRELLIDIFHRLGAYKRRPFTYANFISSKIDNSIEDPLLILDVGAGSGNITKSLARPSSKVLALDIDISRSGTNNFFPIIGDAHNIPIASETIDVVVCTSVLEHLSHPKACVKEIVRVVKPSGLIAVQLPNLRYLFEPHTKWPFLHLMPEKLRSHILKTTGYPELNMKVTFTRVLKWFRSNHCFLKDKKNIYHGLKFAEILKIPIGAFFVFRKEVAGYP